MITPAITVTIPAGVPLTVHFYEVGDRPKVVVHMADDVPGVPVNVVVLGEGAAGSKITVPFGIGYEMPVNTSDTPVNCTVVFVVFGMPLGLNCACTQTTGAWPGGTLNLFQDVLLMISLVAGIVHDGGEGVKNPKSVATLSNAVAIADATLYPAPFGIPAFPPTMTGEACVPVGIRTATVYVPLGGASE